MAETTIDSDVDRLRVALRNARRLLFRNVGALVLLSVCWFVVSLPVVTIGPATLGAYVAIQSLRRTGSVNRSAVVSTVKRNVWNATLLGLLPTVLVGITAINVYAYFQTGRFLLQVAAIGSFYAAVYVSVLLIPVFVALTDETSARTSMKTGHTWMTDHTTLAFTTATLTLAVLVASLLLTVAVVLVFPAVAFVLHLEIVDFLPAEDRYSGAQTALLDY